MALLLPSPTRAYPPLAAAAQVVEEKPGANHGAAGGVRPATDELDFSSPMDFSSPYPAGREGS